VSGRRGEPRRLRLAGEGIHGLALRAHAHTRLVWLEFTWITLCPAW
jgi:hypothetical protein